MSSFKTNRLIFAIGALIIGIILLIWPGASLMIIGRCIGAVLAAGGIVAAFLFWKDHEAMSRTLLLVMAAVMLICGIVIILHPDEQIVPVWLLSDKFYRMADQLHQIVVI